MNISAETEKKDWERTKRFLSTKTVGKPSTVCGKWRSCAHMIRFMSRCRRLILRPLQAQEYRRAMNLYFERCASSSAEPSSSTSVGSMQQVREMLFAVGELVDDDELTDLFARLGASTTSPVSCDIFLQMLMLRKRRWYHNRSANDTEAAFQCLKDTSLGDIAINDMLNLCEEFQLSNDVNRVILETDADGSGRIDFDEFAVLLKSEASTPDLYDRPPASQAGGNLALSGSISVPKTPRGAASSTVDFQQWLQKDEKAASFIGGSPQNNRQREEHQKSLAALEAELASAQTDDFAQELKKERQAKLVKREEALTQLSRPLRPVSGRAATSSTQAFGTSNHRFRHEPIIEPLPPPGSSPRRTPLRSERSARSRNHAADSSKKNEPDWTSFNPFADSGVCPAAASGNNSNKGTALVPRPPTKSGRSTATTAASAKTSRPQTTASGSKRR